MDCARANVHFNKNGEYIPAPSLDAISLQTLDPHRLDQKKKSSSDDCALSDPPTQPSLKLIKKVDLVYAAAVSKAQARHRARGSRRPGSKLLIFDALVGGIHRARSLIDCGSTATLLEQSVFTEASLYAAGIEFRHITMVIKTISGVKEHKSLEVLNVPITVQGITRTDSTTSEI